ncbi:hypothetical protein CR513_09477, partial [Mucuna pruriens]
MEGRHRDSPQLYGFGSSALVKGTENIKEYIIEMSNLTTKFKSLKLELSEDLIVHLVLISLPTQFGTKGPSMRAKDVLELIHTDICGPFSTTSWNGQQNFITFVNDYSRYGYLYLIHEKSQSLDIFKSFKVEVELQLGKKIKAIKSDRGGEYYGEQRSGPFTLFLKEYGIVLQYTMPSKPSMNGVVKRRNRTLKDMSLWGEALKTVVYILNRVSTKVVNKIPYELWIGKQPSCQAEAQPYRSYERKLDSRIVSYAERSRGYKFYDPTSRSFFETGNARIFKEVEFEKEENIRNVVFEEEFVNDIDQVLVPNTNYDEILPQTPLEQPQQPQEVSLRRSIRERRHAIPDDYLVFHQEHEDGIGLTKDDPINFCQAMQSSNSQK